MREEKISDQDTKLLEELSVSLFQELKLEVVMVDIEKHILFKNIRETHPQTLQLIVKNNTMRRLSLAHNDFLFHKGAKASCMHFVVRGTLHYTRTATEEGRSIHTGHTVAEAVLWTDWKYSGSLRAAIECELLAVDAKMFEADVQKDPNLLKLVSRYARAYIEELNHFLEDSADMVTDIFEVQVPDEIMGGGSRLRRQSTKAMEGSDRSSPRVGVGRQKSLRAAPQG